MIKTGQFRSVLLLVLLLHVSYIGVHVKGDQINGKTNADKASAKDVKDTKDKAAAALRALETAKTVKIAKDRAAKEAAKALKTAEDEAAKATSALATAKASKDRAAEETKEAAKAARKKPADVLERALAAEIAADKDARDKVTKAAADLETAKTEKAAKDRASEVAVGAVELAFKTAMEKVNTAHRALVSAQDKAEVVIIGEDNRDDDGGVEEDTKAAEETKKAAEKAPDDVKVVKVTKEVTDAVAAVKDAKVKAAAAYKALRIVEKANTDSTAQKASLKSAMDKVYEAHRALVAARNKAAIEAALATEKDAKKEAAAAYKALMTAKNDKVNKDKAAQKALDAVELTFNTAQETAAEAARSLSAARDKAAKEAPMDPTVVEAEKKLKAAEDAEKSAKEKADVASKALAAAKTAKDNAAEEAVSAAKALAAAEKALADAKAKINKTTTISATVISSTIPAVLITSVVFLYLYNW